MRIPASLAHVSKPSQHCFYIVDLLSVTRGRGLHQALDPCIPLAKIGRQQTKLMILCLFAYLFVCLCCVYHSGDITTCIKFDIPLVGYNF